MDSKRVRIKQLAILSLAYSPWIIWTYLNFKIAGALLMTIPILALFVVFMNDKLYIYFEQAERDNEI